ncbi:MAG: D-glycero-beta-D-manno-heptose 1-phosphate adenylyltransferase [Thermodesulfobacteriota bacterium]
MVPDRERLRAIVDREKAAGRTVVFTNGCFDILHVGHVRYLAAARALGDVLVVGVNSDASVSRIKAKGRPVVPESERAEVLASLAAVDYVILFPEDDPGALIGSLVPHVLVKGADWPEDKIIGADTVKKAGGHVERIPLAPGASTTSIIERIRKLP